MELDDDANEDPLPLPDGALPYRLRVLASPSGGPEPHPPMPRSSLVS
jgi:hypothetical protein